MSSSVAEINQTAESVAAKEEIKVAFLRKKAVQGSGRPTRVGIRMASWRVQHAGGGRGTTSQGFWAVMQPLRSAVNGSTIAIVSGSSGNGKVFVKAGRLQLQGLTLPWVWQITETFLLPYWPSTQATLELFPAGSDRKTMY